MRWIGKIMTCVAVMLIFNASARGVDSLRTSNPYAVIVTRNVFGLLPSPIVKSPAPTPPALPKITLLGITSILGPPAVVLKVTDQSSSGFKNYLLTEGETQDGIEVTRVGADFVFFDNHGTMQQISWAKD